MSGAPLPPDETARLAELRASGLLDSPPDPAFDDLTRVAAHVCGAPTALVSLVDESRQWFKARVGLDAPETPRDVAFCAYAILSRETFVVNDAAADPRFRDNPLVTGPPFIRFYAGAPLRTASGHALGTLCVLGPEPRALPAAQRAALEALARQVVHLVELARSEQRVAESEARFRLLAEGGTDIVVRRAPDGTVLYVSPSCRILGYEPEEAIGKPVTAFLVGEEDRAEFARVNERILATGEPLLSTLRMRAKDGTPRWMETTVRPMKDRAGRIVEIHAASRDVTARKNAEEEKDRFFTLSLDMLAIFAKDGRIERLNPAWSAALGYSTEEMLGRRGTELVHPEDRDRTIHARQTIERTRTDAFENRWRTKDGSYRWLSWTWSTHPDTGATYAVARDVTDRRALEQAKSAFVAMVSHELRTPLTAIFGALGLLDSGVLPESEAREAVRVARGNCDRLVRLVGDILDLEKIGAGRISLRLAEIDASAPLTATVDALTPAAMAANVRLRPRVSTHVKVHADLDRIVQVLTNLVGNAIKFTPPGGTVRVEVADAEGKVRFTVSDEGPGIAPRDVARVFAPFEQLDAARAKGGTGLGLAIAKGLVEQHGGVIGYEPHAAGGSVFFFELPALRRAPPVAASPAAAAPSVDDELHALRAELATRLPARVEELLVAAQRMFESPIDGDALTLAWRRAHALRGTAGSYGFAALSEAVSRLEKLLRAAVETAIDAREAWMRANGVELERAMSGVRAAAAGARA